jgi:hypothetical protein
MATVVDLSDGDIERLLQEAEARLSARQNGQNDKSLTAPAALAVEKTNDPSAAEEAIIPAKEETSTTAKKDELSLREPKVKLSNKAYAEVRFGTLFPISNLKVLYDYNLSHTNEAANNSRYG